MRIWTPECEHKRYWLTLFFQETGRPHPFRIGKQTATFGKGREFAGRFSRAQIEVTEGGGSIELFPGAIILGMAFGLEPGIDPQYQSTLNPKYDAVELVRPSDIVVMPADLARDVAGDNPAFKDQLEVLTGKRKRFIG